MRKINNENFHSKLYPEIYQAIVEYRNNDYGGEKGKFRAARCWDTLTEIDIEKETETDNTIDEKLFLMMGAIFHSGSTQLSRLISIHTGYTKESISDGQSRFGITEERIEQENQRLISSLKKDRDDNEATGKILSLEKITKENILAAIERYLAKPGTIGKTGRIRAENLKDILSSNISWTQKTLFELVYLVKLSGSTKLRDEICAEIGIRVGDIETTIEAYRIAFGYMRHFSKTDAIHALEQEAKIDGRMIQADFALLDKSSELLSRKISDAIANYRKKSRDEQGYARAFNLETTINKIMGSQISDIEKCNQLLLYVSAVILKSGSTEFKKELLTNLKTEESPFKASIASPFTHYEIWKLALKINTLTPFNHWKEYKELFVSSMRSYLQSDMGGEEGKKRGQKIINALNYYEKNETYLKYYLVLYAATLIDIGTEKKSTSVMLDYFSTIKLNEKSILNLKKQFGISEQEIRDTQHIFLQETKVDVTISKQVDPDQLDWANLLEKFQLATARYLEMKIGGSAGTYRVNNVKKILDTMTIGTITAPETAQEQKNDLALLLCTIVLHSDSLRERFKTKVLLNIGWNEAQVMWLKASMTISTEACRAFDRELTGGERELDTTIRNRYQLFATQVALPCPIEFLSWEDFKEYLSTSANQFAHAEEVSMERTVARNLLQKINDINFLIYPDKQHELLTLATAAVLCASAPNLSTKMLEKIGDKKTFATFAKNNGVTKEHCAVLIQQLEYADVAETEMRCINAGQ